MTDPRTGIRHLTATRACARQPQTIGAIDPQELAALQCVFFDCDGVMTDGRVWVDASGNETKAFSVIDGHGVAMLRQSGVMVAMVTRSPAGISTARAQKLRFDVVRTSILDKATAVAEVIAEHNLDPARCAFMGDDLPDLEAFAVVGLQIAPPTARPEVLNQARATTTALAGNGAVREVCDAIAVARARLADHLPSI